MAGCVSRLCGPATAVTLGEGPAPRAEQAGLPSKYGREVWPEVDTVDGAVLGRRGPSWLLRRGRGEEGERRDKSA